MQIENLELFGRILGDVKRDGKPTGVIFDVTRNRSGVAQSQRWRVQWGRLRVPKGFAHERSVVEISVGDFVLVEPLLPLSLRSVAHRLPIATDLLVKFIEETTVFWRFGYPRRHDRMIPDHWHFQRRKKSRRVLSVEKKETKTFEGVVELNSQKCDADCRSLELTKDEIVSGTNVKLTAVAFDLNLQAD